MNFPVPEIISTWQFWAVAVATYVICEVFKQIPYLKNGDHGWITNLFGIVVAVILLCALMGWTAENAIYGVLASAAATLAYEIWSNVIANIINNLNGKTGGTD